MKNLPASEKMRIGIDLGGTKIEVVVVDQLGQIALRQRVATDAHLGVEHIFNRIKHLYQLALVSITRQEHTLGIGTPGSISLKTGLLKNSNTVSLNGVALQQILEEHLQHACQIENDANCFAFAEAMLGAGQDHDCVFGVIMGTGCGGGLVINQQIRIGPQRLSGEWGHMTIDPNGPLCFCGKRGCVETFISGSGLESMFLEKAARPLCAQDIFQLAAQGDPNAALILDIFYDQFGRAISNLIHLLDPDVIVLGGGLSNQEAIYQRGIDAVQKYLFSDELTTPIIKNHLGDSAGVIGAAFVGV